MGDGMDQQQREQFRDLVIAAMDEKSWTATMTAKAAGITTNTMTKVTNAQVVARGTVGKLRQVLGIEGQARGRAREGYPLDVELIRDAVGLWLLNTPQEDRAAKVAHLLGSISNGGVGHDH
jgi:hypothetical protein